MRYLKKTCAVTLSAAMLLGIAAGNGTIALAANKIEKEETVYVNLEADGTVDSVTVSDWLKNVTGTGDISDVSNLKDIKNVKGDETFQEQGDGKIVWKADNKDIYYQGTTSEELPVGVSVSYELDGWEIQPSELAGKSGELKITIHYENRETYETEIDGEKVELNTPFLMASAIIMPVDQFSNITVSQGKIVSEGTNQILIAYGMPGLSESLDLSKDMKKQMDKKLSDTVTITADVEDFSMGAIYTVASSDEFSDIELEDDSDINDVEKAVDDLADATDELLSGSEELSEGLATLQNSFQTYADGVGDVKKGASDLADGAGQLADGISKYTEGVKSLTEGTNQYVSGTQSLVAGVNSYVEGEKLIDSGAAELYTKTKDFPTQYSQFSEGLNNYINGVNQIVNTDNTQALAAGSQQVADGITQISQSLGSLKETVAALAQAENLTEEQKVALVTVTQTIAALEGATAQDSSLGQGASTIAGTMATLNAKAPELVNGGASLKTYSTAIGDGITGVTTGISSLYDGVKKLSANNDTLLSGANTLNEKGSLLTSGAGQLTSSTKKLTSSANQLSAGATKLSKGASKLNDATKDVGDGVDKLSDGSVELYNGVNKFKLEGTGKLQDEYNETIKTVINRFRSLTGDADQYKSFSGLANGMDGKVKFIFQTAGISEDDK